MHTQTQPVTPLSTIQPQWWAGFSISYKGTSEEQLSSSLPCSLNEVLVWEPGSEILCGRFHLPVCKALWRWFHRGPPCWTLAWGPGPTRAVCKTKIHRAVRKWIERNRCKKIPSSFSLLLCLLSSLSFFLQLLPSIFFLSLHPITLCGPSWFPRTALPLPLLLLILL